MTYNEIIAEVAESLDLPFKFVDKTYRAYWKAILEHISSMPLKTEMTEEEFNMLQPNVNIPSIGKLYVTFDKYKRVRKQDEIINEKLKAKKDAQN